MTLNDAIIAATGGPTINDGLSAFYGRTDSETLNDAEYRWLIERTIPPTQINDMWFALLRSLGYTGALNDMKLEFWINGGILPGNLYVNPELAGGGVDTPATGHTVPFNTNSYDYAAIPATVPQQFEFVSNTDGTLGRSPQQYDLAANNPDLELGAKYRIQYTAQSLNGQSYGAGMDITAEVGIVITASNILVPDSGAPVTLFYEFFISDAVYGANIRCGCGTITANSIQMLVSRPVLSKVAEPPVPLPTHYMTMGNRNGGIGYDGSNNEGALVPVTIEGEQVRLFRTSGAQDVVFVNFTSGGEPFPDGILVNGVLMTWSGSFYGSTDPDLIALFISNEGNTIGLEVIVPAVSELREITVGQFPNINKRGYRLADIGSIDPPIAPGFFNLSELLINAGTGKLVLRGSEVIPFTQIEIDGVVFLKANAMFDGFDTWRWSTPVTWLVGTQHTILYVA